jgi:hypothetical protein
VLQVGDISTTFSPVFFPRHCKLSKKEKVEWINRLRTHYIMIQPARMYPRAAFLSVCGCVLHHNSGNRYRWLTEWRTWKFEIYRNLYIAAQFSPERSVTMYHLMSQRWFSCPDIRWYLLCGQEKNYWPKNGFMPFRSFSTAHAVVVSIVAFYLLYISDIFCDDAPYGPVIFRSTILSQFTLGVSDKYLLLFCIPFLVYPHLTVNFPFNSWDLTYVLMTWVVSSAWQRFLCLHVVDAKVIYYAFRAFQAFVTVPKCWLPSIKGKGSLETLPLKIWLCD